MFTRISRPSWDVRAVENPLTSLADDADRTRKMVAQVQGPVVLVGHSYGGAVICEMGNQPNVNALVYIAAFAPDQGESVQTLIANPPPGAPVGSTPTTRRSNPFAAAPARTGLLSPSWRFLKGQSLVTRG